MQDLTSKSYQFTFTATGTVSAVFESEHGRIEAHAIESGETWSRDPVTGTVVRREWEHGREKLTSYVDPEGDGTYARSDRPDHQASAVTGSILAVDDVPDLTGGSHDHHQDWVHAALKSLLGAGQARNQDKEHGLPDAWRSDGEDASGAHAFDAHQDPSSTEAPVLPVMWPLLLVGMFTLAGHDWQA